MSKVNKDLSSYRAVVFDVDGVLSRVTVPMDAEGIPQRTVNVRDGYAIKNASQKGLVLGIITGGYSPAIRQRFLSLGIRHVYMRASMKIEYLTKFVDDTGIPPEDIIYVGDDLPDLEVMERCGYSVAPADACPEVRALADYISPVRGGEGVARDILEEVMKAKGLWMSEESFGW